ncbi:isochorismatase family protein [Asanoa sp. WMMD1127]|uniref:cysteine hydrolase family protein n=1 Tax=Asanoa sp. WMMD1127 TaxID=3016107 RepID=UPI0024173C75|nr:isochorismatase family protein [Asanoa sp. WMMD1127]MDG4824000.1 isochorismatase family protein [Asanoa sp. WMMD1127]
MKRALFVIDAQESFRQREIWRAGSNPDFVDNVNRLVDAFRAAGDTVIWVLHSEPGTGGVFDPVNGHVRLLDGLRVPGTGEPTMVKTSHNVFTTTNAGQFLTERRIFDLTVTGIRTEQCVETTARVGGDLGYAVTFVTDATLTFPIPHRDATGASVDEILADPRTLGVDAIVERTERVLDGRFATVRTVADVLGAALVA